MAHQGHNFKEKIKHMFHHDKNAVTTPDGSPGHADVAAQPPYATTNVPEAFFPGAVPVVPKETHSTIPYSSALGTVYTETKNGTDKFDLILKAPDVVMVATQHQVPQGSEFSPYQGAPQQSTSVPADSAEMMGAPPSGKNLNQVPPSEDRTTAPASEDRELDSSSEAPQKMEGAEERELPSYEDPKGYPIGSESEVQTKEKESGTQIEPTTDGDAEGYPAESEPEVQTKETGSGMQIDDYPDNESKVQTEDYPTTDSVVESKEDNPVTDFQGVKTGEESTPTTDDKIEQRHAQENA